MRDRLLLTTALLAATSACARGQGTLLHLLPGPPPPMSFGDAPSHVEPSSPVSYTSGGGGAPATMPTTTLAAAMQPGGVGARSDGRIAGAISGTIGVAGAAAAIVLTAGALTCKPGLEASPAGEPGKLNVCADGRASAGAAPLPPALPPRSE